MMVLVVDGHRSHVVLIRLEKEMGNVSDEMLMRFLFLHYANILVFIIFLELV